VINFTHREKYASGGGLLVGGAHKRATLVVVVEGVPALRNEKRYDCCPEVYIDITFTVRIQRRKLYYIFNLVVPCFMMSCLRAQFSGPFSL